MSPFNTFHCWEISSFVAETAWFWHRLRKSMANPGKDGKHFGGGQHGFHSYFWSVAGFIVDDINFWLPFQCSNEIPSLLWAVQLQRSLDVHIHIQECWVFWDWAKNWEDQTYLKMKSIRIYGVLVLSYSTKQSAWLRGWLWLSSQLLNYGIKLFYLMLLTIYIDAPGQNHQGQSQWCSFRISDEIAGHHKQS